MFQFNAHQNLKFRTPECPVTHYLGIPHKYTKSIKMQGLFISKEYNIKVTIKVAHKNLKFRTPECPVTHYLGIPHKYTKSIKMQRLFWGPPSLLSNGYQGLFPWG
jgi:hypothetical protein